MWVERDYEVFAVVEILAHILYLRRIDVRHRELYCYRQIDYDLVVGRRLPHVEYSVAYLDRKFGLGACETLRGVLKPEIALVLFTVLFAELCSCYGDFLYFFPALAENLLTLCD